MESAGLNSRSYGPALKTLLKNLDDTGVRVDLRGRLHDWADRPGHRARPVFPDPDSRKRKREFTPYEESLLVAWCSAAQVERVLVGSAVFEQLECLYPKHSWQAYEGRWRKGHRAKQFDNRSCTEGIFPNLVAIASPDEHAEGVIDGMDTGTSLNPEPEAAGETEETGGTEDELSYSDFRVDIMDNMYRWLHITGEEEFLDLLQQYWVVDSIEEFRICSGDALRQKDLSYLEKHHVLPRLGGGSHRWKIERACAAVEALKSIYLVREPEKETWSDDDHEIRLMARLARAANTIPGQLWSYSEPCEARGMCERSLWLMLWLRWVYRPVGGQSMETQRLRRRKDEWMGILEGMRRSRASQPVPEVDIFDPVLLASRTTTEKQLENQDTLNIREPTSEPVFQVPSLLTYPNLSITQLEDATAHEPSVNESTPSVGSLRSSNRGRQLPEPDRAPLTNGVSVDKIEIPDYRPLQSNGKNQQRGVMWLTEEAFKIYRSMRDQRLGEWGVTANHDQTCVLVPTDWAHVPAEDIVDTFAWDQPLSEDGKRRLRINIGDMGVTWARASVWFETWPEKPRRGVDLDMLLSNEDGVYHEMHGSHLCHHGWCVVPSHLVYEPKAINMERISCTTAARNLRSYGVALPETCNRHDPPCLMHLSALTTKETLAIQFSVLRAARGLDSVRLIPTRPPDHPQWYQTFEHSLPLTIGARSVTLDTARLVRPPNPQTRTLDVHVARCPFCPGVQRRWRQITAFWSHLKNLHEEVPRDEKLAEIRRSAELYLQWIRSRSFDYERNNRDTWLMLQQTQSPAFTWEVVQGWRLSLDRRYERYTTPVT